MCGRFKAGFEFREIKVRWQIFNDLDFAPHYNIAPTQTHPIIVERADTVEARLMRWGLVPYWAKDQAIGNKMINARSATSRCEFHNHITTTHVLSFPLAARSRILSIFF